MGFPLRHRVGDLVGMWLVVVAFAAIMLGTTLPTPLYVLYQQEFGFSTLMVTVIFATYGAGVVAMLLVCGHLSDEIGRRRTLLFGLWCSAVSTLVFLLAVDLPMLFVGRLLSGFSAGLVTGTATAAIVDLGARWAPARASMVATITQMIGLGFGPLLGGLVGDYGPAPLRLTYGIYLVLLAVAGVGLWIMPEPVAQAARRPQLRVTKPQVPASMRAVFLRAAVAGFAGFAVLGLFTAVVPSFLRELLQLGSLTLVGAVIFAIFCASAVGQLVLTPLAGRWALPAGCIGLVVGMLGLIGGLAAERFAGLLAGGVVAGLGQGMSFRAGFAEVNSLAPAHRRGDIASTFFVVLYVALAVPVVGVGVAADLWGLRTAGILFSAVVALLAASALVSVLRSERRGGRGTAAPS